MSLRAVFNDFDVPAIEVAEDFFYGVDVDHVAVKMNGDDGFSLRRDGGFDIANVHNPSCGVNVDEHGNCANSDDSGDGRNCGVGNGDDFVATINARGFERQNQRVGTGIAAGDESEIFSAQVVGKLAFKIFELVAEDKPARLDDAIDGVQNFGLDRQIGFAQI